MADRDFTEDDVWGDDGGGAAREERDEAAGSSDDEGGRGETNREEEEEAEEDLEDEPELDGVSSLRSGNRGSLSGAGAALPIIIGSSEDAAAANGDDGDGEGGGRWQQHLQTRRGGAAPTTTALGGAFAAGQRRFLASSVPVRSSAALMGTSLPIAIPPHLRATAAAAAAAGAAATTAGGAATTTTADGAAAAAIAVPSAAASSPPLVRVGAATFVPPHLLDQDPAPRAALLAAGRGGLDGEAAADAFNLPPAGVNWIGQALTALGMGLTPHTEHQYVIWTLIYAFVTGLTYAGFTAFVLEAMGHGAAATKFSLFASLSNFPIMYMTTFDGHAHTRWGPSGMLYAEAVVGVAGLLLFLAFAAGVQRWWPARWAQRVEDIPVNLDALPKPGSGRPDWRMRCGWAGAVLAVAGSFAFPDFRVLVGHALHDAGPRLELAVSVLRAFAIGFALGHVLTGLFVPLPETGLQSQPVVDLPGPGA